jgi:pyridoxine 5-phosphate synthase
LPIPTSRIIPKDETINNFLFIFYSDLPEQKDYEKMIELGVNIDHVATVRQARQTTEPDPVRAAFLAELGGADGITVHLREDRRHINDRDADLLRKTVRCKLNLEMACADEIVKIACRIVPDQATLVPERREEITTEGGLCVADQKNTVKNIVQRLQDLGIAVSLFLDPDPKQIESGLETGCNAIEIHTGCYALAETEKARHTERIRILNAGKTITGAGRRLHAGHGLTYYNVLPIAAIPQMQELNIGHSIISRALMVGLKDAVMEMKRLLSTVQKEK